MFQLQADDAKFDIYAEASIGRSLPDIETGNRSDRLCEKVQKGRKTLI